MSASPRAWRASFAATLTLAMAMGSIMQFSLGVFGPLIMTDLDITRTTFGALNTSYFAVGAIASPLVGRLVDKVGGYPLLIGLFLIVGISFAGMALSPDLVWLWLAVALAGTANALMNPVTNELIATRLQPGKQGIITGLKQSGVQVSTFAAGTVLPPIAIVLGWRAAAGLIAVVSLASILSTSTARLTQSPESVAEKGVPRPVPLRGFVSWLMAYALLMGIGVSSFFTYLPLYAVETLGMSITAGGAAVGLIGFIGIFSRVAWGRRAELVPRPQQTLALIAAVAALSQSVLWAASLGATWLIWVAAIGLGASAAAWNVVGMLAVVRRFQGQGTGHASGVVLLGFFIGLTIAPVTVGASVDRTDSYGLAWAVVTGAFALAAVIAAAWARSEREEAP